MDGNARCHDIDYFNDDWLNAKTETTHPSMTLTLANCVDI